MKISGLCASSEHDSCSEHLFHQNGKRFVCVCKCHVKVIEPKARPVEDENG